MCSGSQSSGLVPRACRQAVTLSQSVKKSSARSVKTERLWFFEAIESVLGVQSKDVVFVHRCCSKHFFRFGAANHDKR